MEDEESNTSIRKCTPKTRNFRGTGNVNTFQYYHHHQFLQNPYGLGCNFGYTTNQYQFLPALLPLPPTVSPYFLQNQRFESKNNFKMAPRNQNNSLPATSFRSKFQDSSVAQVAKRPDSGGVEGKPITLLANHFLVKFDPAQKIFHYNVEINPNPSKELARTIKRKLVEENPTLLSNARPVFDGRKAIYSPVEFQNDKLEFHISLPIEKNNRPKIFRVNIKLVSKIDDINTTSLPQEYIHALDVVLRESPNEKCVSIGPAFYTNLMGCVKEIGGGAIALNGFFQSLRPTQQGLSLNVDYSVTAFHESIGVIPYLQKRVDFMRDVISRKNTRILTGDEKNEVEKVLWNLRIFVCHRETVQRYRVCGLTEEITENLWFTDRDGKKLRLVSYFKDHYEYDVKYTNLPCLKISRRKPCYLPMELCVICEGQKFLGKLSDDQTVKLLKMGCQKPRERKKFIDSVMEGHFGPTSGNQGKDFNLHVSKEMTRLTGRILKPPKLKLGDGGHVRNLTPFRHDRQWNLLDSHVFEGTRVEHWAIISFGGTHDLQKFINQLFQKCEQIGIYLNKNTVVSPFFEPMHVLGNPKLLEAKLKKIHKAASENLQLLICVMERKHKGYADLKRIAETSVGIVTQCCLYPNLGKTGFLSNLALKINAKIGGCTVALYNSLHSEIPRIFRQDEAVIFMGADVTHPHPSDDFSPSVAAVVGSINWPAANKYVSRMRSQTHRQEIIEDLRSMVTEILDDFYRENSELPKRIVFFRDGVSETQFDKILREEIRQIREACMKYKYSPPITFVVVQKRHHTRLFPAGGENDENVPPGTVVDTVITHRSEFDFYLCSHWGVKGTSRPVHYHVLWDENGFTSDEVQKLVYNLCYTFVRCTKPISLVPPVYYAHLAAYRGRLYIDRSEGSRSCETVSRASTPEVVGLPKLSDNIRKLMFYC
ncbi:protein argonaute 7 [Phtheirospermum japonicum]|uniref:Protein argonaute 7 n=1 Tax=Phtheirospermum japonicum TaxID=374723 RepID=A0A830CUZ8_9LAMI|nr:protein argonaute 7 [Phtheirospermum japonicum]